MSAAEPLPDAPTPPTSLWWVGPMVGLAAAMLALLAARGGPLAAPGALAGHALAFGVLAAMAVDGLILRRQRRALDHLGEPESDGGWPGEALQACLAQVRATPSLTDRHEILRMHRERWQARLDRRLLAYFLAGALAALGGLLAVLTRLPEPGTPLNSSELFLPLTIATVETVAACLAVTLVWHGWSAVLVEWEAQALGQYQSVERPTAAVAWDVPKLPEPIRPPPAANGQPEPGPLFADTTPPATANPIPFGQVWGSPSGGEPTIDPGSSATEAPSPEGDDPGPDYGR